MAIRLSFHGAARSVTGSCFRLETDRSQILIDCGLFQGSKSEKELNYRSFPFRPKDINAVVLSHAHIDHSGLLPKLVKADFRGRIYATPATGDLAHVMLLDSAHIQETEVEQLNNRMARRDRGRVEPIYRAKDVVECSDRFRPVRYLTWFDVTPDVRARFWNAGHLLGSASVEVEVAKPIKTSLGEFSSLRILGRTSSCSTLTRNLPTASITSSAKEPTVTPTASTPPKSVAERCCARKFGQHRRRRERC